ncbi:MAG TPA: vitamin B12 dependent-methionine synthase activation domain-containing protein [Bacteroidales bacterium]|nr:vitamin B12 dependent-methionine synthase activation domain-containing protein [Bacteroidales bacterium]
MPERVKLDFEFSDLNLNAVQIGRLIDYDKSGGRDIIGGIIEDSMNEAAGLCDIKAEFAIHDKILIGKGVPSVRIGDVVLDTGKIIPGQLNNSESIAVFICTAGGQIGEYSRQLMAEKDFLKGYILDIIGSQAADIAADLMQAHLNDLAAARGLKTTNRYSPGYCGWQVSEQQKLFSLIPGNYCGVVLNNSSLMYPVKSVSGIIGIGRNVKFNMYTCDLCDQENCIYRNYKINQQENAGG